MTRLYPSLLALLLLLPLQAKDKKKSSLPEYVLKATTVLVTIAPENGEPIDRPKANTTARQNVEQALMRWGRLQPVTDGMPADLIIVVRTGTRFAQPTIKGGPIDQRVGIGQGTDGGVLVGGGNGNGPPMRRDQGSRLPAHVGSEIGPSEDAFEVYQGGIPYPLDAPAVWRYVAKNCLQSPQVQAVEEFRKAIAKAEQVQVPKEP